MSLFKKAMLALATLVLAVVTVVVPANKTTKVEAATIPAGQTLYLDAGVWDVDGARFAAYFFDGTAGAKWVNMESVELGIYKVDAPSNGTSAKVIFCRMNPASATNDWSNKWNQSNDLTWDGSKNLYKITGWGSNKSTGTWGTYTPAVPGNMVVGLSGNFGGVDAWDPDVDMNWNAETQSYEIVKELIAGDKFKVRLDNAWNSSYGDSAVDSASKQYLSAADNDGNGNVVVKVAGTYKISFTEKGVISLELLAEPFVPAASLYGAQLGVKEGSQALRLVGVVEVEDITTFDHTLAWNVTKEGSEAELDHEVTTLYTGVLSLGEWQTTELEGAYYTVLTLENIPDGVYTVTLLENNEVVGTATYTIAAGQLTA